MIAVEYVKQLSSILALIQKLGSFHLHVPKPAVRDVVEEVSTAVCWGMCVVIIRPNDDS